MFLKTGEGARGGGGGARSDEVPKALGLCYMAVDATLFVLLAARRKGGSVWVMAWWECFSMLHGSKVLLIQEKAFNMITILEIIADTSSPEEHLLVLCPSWTMEKIEGLNHLSAMSWGALCILSASAVPVLASSLLSEPWALCCKFCSHSLQFLRCVRLLLIAS